MKFHKNFDLILTSKVWGNDYHDLIDYENQDITKKVFKINSSGFLSRINNDIIFSSENNPSNELLKIRKNEENKKYYVDCGNWSKDLSVLSNETGAFIVYKSSHSKKQNRIINNYYKLNQGDIIRIGRIYIKLLDMQLEEEINKEENTNTIHDKNAMIRNSSFNSTIFKGQEVIKGTFINSSSNIKQKYNLSNKNFKNDNDNLLLLSKDNKLYNKSNQISNNYINNSKIINNLKNKNNFFLPRINSCEELFMIKPKIKLNIENDNKNKIINNIRKIPKEKIKNCRICYGNTSEKENPLICPCVCNGSMKYIHFLCLKNWLNSKIESKKEVNSKENTTIAYNRKDIYCELCKTQFPDLIRYNGTLYNIVFYKPKFKEYVMFETLRLDKHNTKYIYIISLDDKKLINIGRSRDCEFSIPEISISRFHSIIHKDKGELYIEDNKSKFGTLILIQNNNLEIKNKIPLKLQINHTYIKIKMNSPLLYSCCNRVNTTGEEKSDYQSQNKEFLNVFSYFNIKDNNNIDFEKESNDEEKQSNIRNLSKKLTGFKDININEEKNNDINEDTNLFYQKNKYRDYIICDSNKNNLEKIKNSFNKSIYNRNIKSPINQYNNNTSSLIKKNNINLIIEDCNNKYFFKNNENNRNHAKMMRKIKITKNQNNKNNNDENFLQDIKKDITPLEINMQSSLNINQIQSLQSKGTNTLSLLDTNLNVNNNNVFIANKVKPVITINKHKILNSFFNLKHKLKHNVNFKEQVEFLSLIQNDNNDKQTNINKENLEL